MRSIVWFREDLRIHDNTALFEATEASYDGIVGLYIIDETLWKKHHVAACRIHFILSGLAELSDSLQKLNIPLLIKTVSHTDEIPSLIANLAKTIEAHSLFFNRQYEVDFLHRDEAVETHLNQAGINALGYHDQMIISPRSEHSKTFATYRKLWVKNFVQQGGVRILSDIHEQKNIAIPSDPVPTTLPGLNISINPKLWPAGEKTALKRLQKFTQQNLATYDKTRDFPHIDGTSKLSPYLAAGMLSPRKAFLTALEANDHRLGDGNAGAIAWMNELIWRDFYKHIVVTVPRISMHQAYQPQTEGVVWHFDPEQYQAWTTGQTGFPIIDAAMRQLKKTGWMHSRLRMITATFFTKYMFFDWRLGEAFFMENLIDGDLAANNCGWQSCASTGPDADAYFRFFDPLRHSDRYDPDGKFIKKYCPELAQLSDYAAHFPHTRAPSQAEKTTYPLPILDLKQSRARAVAGFRDGTTTHIKEKK